MSKYLPVLLVASLSLAFAPAPLPRPPKLVPGKDDLKAMQGTWEFVSRTSSGRPTPGTLGKMGLVGNKLSFYRADGSVATTWVLTLEPKKSPRGFERKRETPPFPTAGGVYELKGDSLIMCYTRNGAERPTDFDDKQPGRGKEVYRRVKR